MKLQEGKYYRDVNDKKVGPMRKDHDFDNIWDCKSMFPNDGDFHWFGDGKAGYGACGAIDLVAEWVDEPTQTGTLKELNVQPGDVVEWVSGHDGGYIYPDIPKVVTIDRKGVKRVYGIDASKCYAQWRIISRVSRDDTPTLWRDMSAEEKGALLLAAHEGKVIEVFRDGLWLEVSQVWIDNAAYRVKPDYELKIVKLYFGELKQGALLSRVRTDTHRITFETINGEPDPASIRMDKL